MKRLLIFAFFSLALLGASAKEIIVNTTNISPFCFEENGRPRGIAIEILDEVSQATGIGFRYRFLPWKRAQLQTQVASGEAIIPLTRFLDRERDYQWVAPLFAYSFVLVTRRTTPAPTTLDEAKSLHVGVLRGSPMESLLPKLGFKDIQPGKSEDEIAKQLHANLIDAWVVADVVAAEAYRKVGGIPDDLHFGVRIGEPMWIYLGASPQFPKEDQQQISDAVKRLRSKGEINRIVDKYRKR